MKVAVRRRRICAPRHVAACWGCRTRARGARDPRGHPALRRVQQQARGPPRRRGSWADARRVTDLQRSSFQVPVQRRHRVHGLRFRGACRGPVAGVTDGGNPGPGNRALEIRYSDGRRPASLREEATGLLLYTPQGWMVRGESARRAPALSTAPARATCPRSANCAAFDSYFTTRVATAPPRLRAARVSDSLNPDFPGRRAAARPPLDGDSLVLSARTVAGPPVTREHRLVLAGRA